MPNSNCNTFVLRNCVAVEICIYSKPMHVSVLNLPFFFFLVFLRAALVAYGISQDRGQMEHTPQPQQLGMGAVAVTYSTVPSKPDL